MNDLCAPRRLPWPARVLNSIGSAAERRRALLPFEPEALMARAARGAGLSDFAPEVQFTEGLERLCQSIEADVRPTLFGRLLLQDIVLRVLGNRLLWVHHRRVATHRTAGALNPPLIIIGVPRSGTTLLHRLLSLDPGARALPMWELQRPFPPLGPDRRRLLGRAAIRLLRWAAVDLDVKHSTSGDSVEECMLLLDTSLTSLSFWVFAPVYGYLSWWQAQDMTAPYRSYREHLSFLQADTPRARLTLKAPAHTGCLEALLLAIPDAMLVQTHRDPGVVIPSMNSLFSSLHASMTDATDPRRMAEANTSLLLKVVAANQRARATTAKGKVLDVRYEDLTRDPGAVVRRIYDHHRLPFTQGFAARLDRAVDEERRRERPRHHYRAEDFGQKPDALREAFAPYIQEYLAQGAEPHP